MPKEFITQTKAKTKIIDRGANAILRNIEKVGKESYVSVGIHKALGERLPKFNGKIDGKTPVVQYAFWNEYGTKNIPPRSFLGSTFDEKLETIHKKNVATLRKMYTGAYKAEDILNRTGKNVRKWTKAKIWNLRTPPNSPAYARMKKKLGRGSNPLIYSDTMRHSITYEVHFSEVPDTRLRKILDKADKALMRLSK